MQVVRIIVSSTTVTFDHYIEYAFSAFDWLFTTFSLFIYRLHFYAIDAPNAFPNSLTTLSVAQYLNICSELRIDPSYEDGLLTNNLSFPVFGVAYEQPKIQMVIFYKPNRLNLSKMICLLYLLSRRRFLTLCDLESFEFDSIYVISKHSAPHSTVDSSTLFIEYFALNSVKKRDVYAISYQKFGANCCNTAPTFLCLHHILQFSICSLV